MQDLAGVTAIGIDELHHGRGKTSLNFLMLVYQIDRGSRRLLWIGRSRSEATLRAGLDELETWHSGFAGDLRVVCSDMWKPFLKVVRERCGQALNVLDPFHVAKRQYTNAMVEGMNHKARVSLARSFGHRSFEVLKLVLYHNLGELPEPPCSHKFC